MEINAKKYLLKFRHPFTISRGTKTHQPTLVVELGFWGLKGYGEAPANSYYDITVEKMMQDLEEKKGKVEKFAFTEPERFWHFLHHLFPGNPFLVCALDMAAWDLYGQMINKPLYGFWKGDISGNPITDYTIGIDSLDNMIKKIREKPWPVYKIKVDADGCIDMLRGLREITDAVFRVDANGAWSMEEAIDFIPQMKKLGVELVEQPLDRQDWPGMKVLSQSADLPLFADESCVSEEDVIKCDKHFHGINIKLTKCGGITPAIRMIKKARDSGLKIMLGSMCESAIGSSAVAHLLPFADYADLDGPLLLEEEIARGISIENGKIIYGGGAGLGISIL